MPALWESFDTATTIRRLSAPIALPFQGVRALIVRRWAAHHMLWAGTTMGPCFARIGETRVEVAGISGAVLEIDGEPDGAAVRVVLAHMTRQCTERGGAMAAPL